MNKKGNSRIYTPYLLSISSGILASFSLPGVDLDFLVWFSLIPLFLALKDKNYKESFGLGFLGGITFFATLFYWIPVLRIWAGGIVFFGYVLLVLFSALFWGAFGLLYSFLKGKIGQMQFVIIVPSIWIVLEYIRASGQFGTGWGDLGYSLYRRCELIQFASLTGIWGISFLIVLINYLLYLGFKDRKVGYILACLIILALTVGLGFLTKGDPGNQELGVALVQPNVRQNEKSNPQNTESLLGKYRRSMTKLKGEKIDLVIFPESVFPVPLLDRKEILAVFTSFARDERVYLLLGTATREGVKYYNSAVLISPQGKIVDKYNKVKLAPFGEYLPLRSVIKGLGISIDKITPLLGDLTPGNRYQPIESELGVLATPICFESAYPQPVRRSVAKGAEVVITITNDAWFLNTGALWQHFAKGVFRAVENGRFFIQTANTGISGIISSRGRIIKQSLAQEEGVILGEVALGDERTVYNLLGDWFVLLAVLFLAVSLATASLGCFF